LFPIKSDLQPPHRENKKKSTKHLAVSLMLFTAQGTKNHKIELALPFSMPWAGGRGRDTAAHSAAAVPNTPTVRHLNKYVNLVV